VFVFKKIAFESTADIHNIDEKVVGTLQNIDFLENKKYARNQHIYRIFLHSCGFFLFISVGQLSFQYYLHGRDKVVL